MATQDASELVVAGAGDVWFAPYGTALPTTVNTAPGGFNKAGYVSEDGVKVSYDKTVKEFGAWQSAAAVRISRESEEFKISCALEQWNEDNLIAAFGGGTVTSPTAGIYKFAPLGATEALDDVSVVVDWADGTEYHRLVIPKANAIEGVEFQLQRTELSVLPLTLKALQVSGSDLFNYYTNSTAFSLAS